MNLQAFLSSSILIAISCSLTACFSSSKVTSKNETSVGAQLTDLNHARQQQIITEKEYLALKKALIKNND
jgi:hypothetical protein